MNLLFRAWFVPLALFFFLSNPARGDHPTVAFGAEGSGPINTIAATTLERGQWTIGVRTEVIDFDAFNDAALEGFAESGLEDVHSVDKLSNSSLALAYGISNDFTVSVRLPYVKRENIREGELEDGVPEAHAHGDASGVGDAVVLGQYRFAKRENMESAVLFGAKTPTGDTHVEDDGARLETEFQPSTGSWDFLLGAAVSRQSGRIGYHGNVLYNLTTEGSQDTEIGNAIFYNAAITYRLSEPEHHHNADSDNAGHGHLAWDLMLELNGETRGKNEIAGNKESNSGGTVIYLSPGVRISGNSDWSAFFSVGIPVAQNSEGVQTDADYRLVAGFSISL